jgi:FkbM family methyltransferase
MLTRYSVLRVFTPVYFFRPQQIFARLWRELAWRSKVRVTVRLPWGLPIVVDPHEAIGYNIASQGLYESVVTEALWRLTKDGELAVDAGANIGHMASVLATKLGSKGRALCFEPHPEMFSRLRNNVDVWRKDPLCAEFQLHQQALWSQNGQAMLLTDNWFATNRGTAWVSSGKKEVGQTELPIETVQLDTVLSEHSKIGVLKMDIQGGELDALRGMSRLLAEHSVRDIVFEETRPFPAPTHQYLKAKGYSIFGLEERFWGIRLLLDAPPRCDAQIGPIPNYLATCNPDRARRLLTPPGWRSFGWMKFLGYISTSGQGA